MAITGAGTKRRGRYASGRGVTKRRGGRSSSYRNAQAIARLNKRTGGFMGLELKFFDTQLAAGTSVANSDDWSGCELDPLGFNCLNSVGQGTSESQRLGRHFNMKSIHVTGVLHIPQTSNTIPLPDKIVHIALVLDKQTNGTTPDAEDIFINPTGNPLTNASPFRKLDETDRYRVLKSKTIMLRLSQNTMSDAVNNFEHGGLIWRFSFFVDLRGMKVMMKGTGATATVADIQDKSLHIVANCTNTGVDIAYNSRLRFTTS